MKMSPLGLARLIAREGAKLHAYQDSIGVWTIGVGHTSAAGPPVVTSGLTISREECDAILTRDIVQYEKAVSAVVKVKVNQNQFDALTSLCFNIGPGNFSKSSLVKRLNAGDVVGAADAFLAWNRAGNKVLNGLVIRRAGERAQFLEGVPVLRPLPPPPDVPPVKPKPSVGWLSALLSIFTRKA